jgi:hypothetical protein
MDKIGQAREAGITVIRIHDGPNEIWSREFSPPLSGEHLDFDETNVWDITGIEPLQVRYGLGISVETIFDHPHQKILFSAAGIYLKYPG